MIKTKLPLYTFIFLIFQLYSCEFFYEKINVNELELKDSLWHKKGSNELFSGIYIRKYSNGKIKEKATLKNGQLQGKFEKYYDNESIESKGYLNNKSELEGTFRLWYKSGSKASIIHYRDGNLHGKFTEWYEDGQINSRGKYDEGELDGLSEKFFENGKYEGYSYYNKGDLDSLFLFFNNGNKKVELKYLDGKDNSSSQEWDSTGVLIDYWGLKDGKLIDLKK